MEKRRPPVPAALDWPVLTRAAECLKVLAHPVRLAMVELLLRGRFTVGDLARECGIASALASEHLRLMERCGLLSRAKEGRKTYYSTSEPHLADLLTCVRGRFSKTR